VEGRHDRRLWKEGMRNVAMYLRTSSATNINGDSQDRQVEAIEIYAEANDMEIVVRVSDLAVKGSDSIYERQGFVKLIDYCVNNKVDTILCENASRFARDVIVQEMGYRELKKLKLQLIPVDAPDYFTGDSPSLTMIRQILGSVAEFEKSNLVSKLRGARERVKAKNGKCEGRKSLREIMGDKRFVSMMTKMKSLRKSNKSYASIAVILAEQGFIQPNKGKPFHKSQIMRLIQLGG
jgi:DNA invertase Pin-like site-specific DNA recombinase